MIFLQLDSIILIQNAFWISLWKQVKKAIIITEFEYDNSICWHKFEFRNNEETWILSQFYIGHEGINGPFKKLTFWLFVRNWYLKSYIYAADYNTCILQAKLNCLICEATDGPCVSKNFPKRINCNSIEIDEFKFRGKVKSAWGR